MRTDVDLGMQTHEGHDQIREAQPGHLVPNSGFRRRLLRLDEVCEMLSLSRSMVYRLVLSGALPSVKVGRSRRFRIEAVEHYLESLGGTVSA